MYDTRSRGSDKGEIFVREFVIGIGFVSGLFWRVGVDPEAMLFRAFLDVYLQLSPDVGLSWYFLLAPLFLTAVSWLGAYLIGGILGLLAVFIALVGGFFYDNIFGWILIIVAVIFGANVARRQSSNYY